MGGFSDQAAADRAALQGEAGIRTARHPPLYAIEPAAGLDWAHCPSVFFTSRAPVCDRCGQEVSWLGVDRKADDITDGVASIYVYRVICACMEEVEGQGLQPQIDEIEVGFPLRIGGTHQWWTDRDWKV